mgnify:CR=1 FL=1
MTEARPASPREEQHPCKPQAWVPKPGSVPGTQCVAGLWWAGNTGLGAEQLVQQDPRTQGTRSAALLGGAEPRRWWPQGWEIGAQA